MTVYHGSTTEIKKPDVSFSKKYLDFGIGVYVTAFKNQAEKWALRKADRVEKGIATVNVFDMAEELNDYKVLDFKTENEEWLDFVCDNRDGTYYGPQYDFKFGPVANDDVYRTLALYRGGQLSREDTLKQLKIKTLYNQLVFATAKALSFIRFMYSEVVS